MAVGGEFTAIFAAVDELIPAYIRGTIDIVLDGAWYFTIKYKLGPLEEYLVLYYLFYFILQFTQINYGAINLQ